ncbi:DUF6597 domain-containing transcriptional factor [Methylococcus capsulatus]|uniref:DUF6597 domain-containing protein n=1 Tax=Methylococcus capsulatus TaxID=414 RepID=A0AA35UGV3_METCP|nr:DUF6597 domain-containing transcriptional factor [Methylococcus capsulatus]CAI8769903.1 protein of unknown function [Methylococcus capsulatus]
MSAFHSFPPSPLLAPFVSALWVHDDLMKPELGTCTVLPDTASYVCFLCGDHPIQATHRHRTYTTLSGVSGFQTHRFDLESRGAMSGVTVRLTRFFPGADTAALGGKSHDYPEEIFIVSGRLYDQAFELWLETGHYASRPPGEVHGPFRTDDGCVVLEISFPQRTAG